MENYRVAIGHNVATGLLVPVNQQPRGSGAIPVDRKYAITGKVHDDALFHILYFDMISEEEEYWDILFQFGVSVNPSSPITFMGRDRIFTERKFNGVAQQPHILEDVRWEDGFIRGVALHITHLEELDP